MLKKLLNPGQSSTKVSLGLLILRVGLGATMLTHGYPKFRNLIAGEFKFGDPIGLGVELSFTLTVFAEFLCSILLIVGLGSRLATIPLIITMLVAWLVVHINDPFGSQEKAVMYLIAFIALLLTGPGKYSLDKRLFG